MTEPCPRLCTMTACEKCGGTLPAIGDFPGDPDWPGTCTCERPPMVGDMVQRKRGRHMKPEKGG